MSLPTSNTFLQNALTRALSLQPGSVTSKTVLQSLLAKADVVAPTATLQLDKSTFASGQTATLTIRFSETVVGFSLDDLQATGGSLANLVQSTIDPLVWTATFTPTAGVQTTGSITLSNGFTDVAGNTGVAATSSSYSIDTLAPTATITAARESLRVGESTTLTIEFSEDVGTSFDLSDLVAHGGTLSNLQGTGPTRTVTLTATQATGLSTDATVSLAAGAIVDAAGNASTQDASVDVATAFNKVLFVGNSATFARVDPVMSYNTYDPVTNPGGVHDLTSPDQGGTFLNYSGTNLYEPHDWGGVAGLVDAFADQVGLGYDISLSTRNAATLKGHYLNSAGTWDLRSNLSSDKWDIVVLQDQTDEPLPGGTGSITFAPGSSTATLIVTPTADTLKEYDETLSLTLSANAAYRVGTSSTVTTTLLNDDPTAPASNPALPTVTLTTNGSVLEDGNANLVFTFTRTGPTTSDLVVNFTPTRDGTQPSVASPLASTGDVELYSSSTNLPVAIGTSGSSARFSSGGGFTLSSNTGPNTTTGSVSFSSGGSGTITIKAGQTQASVTYDPRADATVAESDESIRFTLNASANYNVGTQGSVTGTIVNDDFAPGTDLTLPNITLGVATSAVYENAGQSLVYTFTRSGSTANALTVNFKEDGTATYFASDASKSDFSLSTTGATAAFLETTSGSNADIGAFEKYANLIEDYIHTGAADSLTQPGTTIPANPNANPEADVYLYATWARPDMIVGAYDMVTDKTLINGGPQNGAYTGGTISQTTTQATAYYLRLEDMSEDLTAAYSNLALANPDFEGVAAVSSAFMNAVTQGIAIRDPYTQTETDSVTTGKINLWFDDNLHASKYGSYLAGLTLFQTISGLDARVLGAGDRVAADLGIDAATAVALQGVASATAGFNQTFHWTAPGVVSDLGGSGITATLVTAGAYSFVDSVYSVHSVTVQGDAGNLGALVANVRSDGHAGQVNWLYTVDNAHADPLLQPGEQRVDQFTVLLDDGHGNVTTELIGVTVVGMS